MEFVADEAIIDQIIDWFGKEIRIVADGEDRYRVSVRVSPKAMEHWAMQYSNHMEIVSPGSFRERMKELTETAAKKYR